MSLRAALVGTVVLVLAGPASAAPYETFIEIETEEDLYDLLAEDQIDEDTFETLLTLYQRGLDLNEASRQELYSLPNLTYDDVDAILDYRDEAGHIPDPVVLVQAGALSEEKLLAIAPFLVMRDPLRSPFAVDGWTRAQTRWSAKDDRVPPMALQARVATLKHLTVGVAATLTRNRVGEVVYDPNRDALSAEAPSARLQVPKGYAEWETRDLHLIAGTYRIGFGQRLTFDNTDQYTPNGIYRDDQLFRDTSLGRRCKESAGELADSPCAGAARDVYITPDFRWREGLRGAAAGVKKLSLGPGELQAYGFVSRQARQIYQYEIYDRGRCEDPRDDEDPACSAPNVYRRDEPLLAPTSRFSFHTLPDMFRETVAGGNVSYSPSRRMHVGLTGYGADVQWLTEGMDLDFQEWSRLPFGGPFGAIGADVAWGRGWADLFVEAAHSFDSMTGGGGGPAALVRGVGTWGKSEVEASLRYYDTDFANPYARPISQPDQYDGLRARDEAGARLRYTGVIDKRVHLRANADFWVQPSDGAPNTLLYLRGDVDATKAFRWGLWGLYQNKDLRTGDRDQCFSVSVEYDERGEPIPCGGQKMQLIARSRYQLHRNWAVTGQLQGQLLDDGSDRYEDSYRKDVSAWATLTGRIIEAVRFSGRARYLFQAVDDSDYLEQSLWLYGDLWYRLRHRDRLRLRYDLYVWLDDRASTERRKPSPEHWLWLEYESRF